MMHEIFKDLFGKENPFKDGKPIINVFYMSSPEKPIKAKAPEKTTKTRKKNEESTLKQILRSMKNMEAGQVQSVHVGGS